MYLLVYIWEVENSENKLKFSAIIPIGIILSCFWEVIDL